MTLGEALDPLRFLATKRGLEVACTVDKDVPDELVGDAGRLKQVIANLVGNGIKFTPMGYVDLRVALAATPAPGAVHLLLAVRDTGLGIAREQRSQVFEPFWQAASGDGSGTSGAGLGLAIVREIVTLMGGQVWVESEVGRGSVFYFTAAFGPAAAGAAQIT
jgi:signal transduction histidine kinase